MVADHQNMGLYTLFCQISAILAEILWKIDFSITAALICIKIIRGTFCWPVNIANRFLRVFSDLVIPIKSIFHGVHGTPLFRLDYFVGSWHPNIALPWSLVGVNGLKAYHSGRHVSCLLAGNQRKATTLAWGKSIAIRHMQFTTGMIWLNISLKFDWGQTANI